MLLLETEKIVSQEVPLLRKCSVLESATVSLESASGSFS